MLLTARILGAGDADLAPPQAAIDALVPVVVKDVHVPQVDPLSVETLYS